MANQSIKAAFERFWAHVVIALSDKVDLTSTQTVDGVKTFSNGIKIGDATVSYNSEDKALVINCD